MALAPSVRRALTVLTAAGLTLGMAPLLGTAAAAAPVLAETTPQGGARVQPTGTVSASYDVPLDAASRISVKDSADGTPLGGAKVELNKITYTTASVLREGEYRVVVDAVNAVDKTTTRTSFAFVVDSTRPVGTTVTLPGITGSNAGSVPVSGIAEPFSTVTLSADDKNPDNNVGLPPQPAATPVTKQVLVPASGDYSTTMDLTALTDGSDAVTVTATATDQAGNVESGSASATVSKDTVAPAGTTVVLATDPVNRANRQAVTITGAAEPGSLVQVLVTSGAAGSPSVTKSVVADGTYELVMDLADVHDGTLTATARAADAAGNTSAAATDTAHKDTTAPALTVTVPGVISQSNVGQVTVSGATEAGRPVTIALGNLPPVTVDADDKGAYTRDFDATTLAQGDVTVTATTTDAVGNPASATAASHKDTEGPIGTTIAPLPTHVRDTLTVAGTAEPHSTVTVEATDVDPALPALPSEPVSKPVKAGALGTYNVELPIGTLHDGTVTVTATAADTSANPDATDPRASRQTTKDTRPPAAPGLDAVPVVNSGNAATVPLSGTRDLGSSVEITVSDSANPVKSVTRTVLAGDSSAWSATLDLAGLSDGTLTVTATSRDAAGNVSAATTKTTRKDVVAPAAPVLDPIAVANVANEKKLPITGTREPGSSVAVTVADASTPTRSVPAAAVAGDSATWSAEADVSSLADGDLRVTAVATDPAGNTSVGSAAVKSRKDTVAPGVPAVDPLAPVNAMNVGGYEITGEAEPLSQVLVLLDDSGTTAPLTATVRREVTTSDAGRWTATLDVSSLDPGDITATVTATDLAGNTSTPASATTNKDVTAPAAPSVTGTDPVVATNVAQAVVEGVAEAGATVTISADDADAGTPPVTRTSGPLPAGGAYSETLDLRSLVDGPLTYSATARDAAGNVSAAGTDAAVRNVTALALRSASPSDGSTVRTVPTVTLTFNEPVLEDGSLVVSNRLGTALAGSTSLSADGTALIFKPTDTLTDAGSPYAVTYAVTEARAPQTQALGSGETLTFSIDPNRQNAPVVRLTDPVTSANSKTATVSGTVDRLGSSVAVSVDDTDGATAPVTGSGSSSSSDGTFSVPVDLSSLRDGQLTATVTASEGGVASSPGTDAAVKDATPPAGTTLDAPAAITQANQKSVRLTGAAEPGSSVTGSLTRGGTTLVADRVVVGSDGTYVATMDATTLTDGEVVAGVVATDAVGNAATPVERSTSKDATGPALQDVSVTDPVTQANQAAVAVSGRTESERPVDVSITDGVSTVTAPTVTGALLDGAFSTTVDVTRLANDVTLVVRLVSTDSLGNASTTTRSAYKDAVGPVGTTLVVPGVNALNQAAVTLTGTGEPGAALRVVVSDTEAVTDLPKTADVVGTATIRSDGTFATMPLDLSALREGRLLAEATVTDGLGNVGAGAAAQTVKDTVAPVLSTVAVPKWVNAANAAALKVVGSTTGDATQASVSLDDADATTAPVEKTVAVSAGAFEAVLDSTALRDTTTDGLIATISIRDASGNPTTTTRTSTKDTQAPVVTGLKATDLNVANPSTTVSGLTEPGSAVTAVVSDGSSSSSGTTTSGGDGAFSVALDAASLANGLLTVTTVGTDPAGNVGSPVDRTISKDAVAPGLTTVALPTVALANQDAAPVSGVADPGSSLTITVADSEPLTGGLTPTGDVTGTVQAGTDGRYTLPLELRPLRDGTLTVTAVETDTAGNRGEPVSTTARKDTVAPTGTTAEAPTAVTAANQEAVAVTGTAEPSSSVEVSADDADVATPAVADRVIAGGDGAHRTVLNLTSLSDGALQVRASATDSAGNTGEPFLIAATKDTAGPSVTLLQFTSPITATNASTSAGSGRSEPAAAVAVTVQDSAGNAASGVGQAGSDGQFEIPVSVASLADGVLTVTARATDVHGNTGAPSTTTVQKDTSSGGGGGTGGGGTGTGGGGGSTDTSPSASPSASTSPSTSPSPSPSTSPSASPSASPSPSTTPSTSPSPTPTAVAPRNGAGFIALTSPTRVLDSRDGTGTPRGVKRGRVVLDLSRQIPAGATAAVLNLTVTNPTGNGFVVVYPDGNAKPGTSNVNFVRNQTQANEVVVGLPASRRVVVFVDSASANVIADLVGFFTASDRPDLGRVITQAPARVLDTRDGTGTTQGRKRNEVVLDLTGKVPAGTTSVALNVTVAGPSARGFVVVYPSGTARPGTSNVNFELGQTQANEVVTRLGTGASAGKVSLFVDSATAAVIVDLVASVVPRDGNGSQLFTTLEQPQRVMDTRDGTGAGSAGRRSGSVTLTLPSGAVPAGATGVVLNVTTTGASRTGFVSVFPTGTANPGTSNVNFRPGINQANEVLTAINGSRQVTLLVGGSGTPLTHVIVDVVGYLTETG